MPLKILIADPSSESRTRIEAFLSGGEYELKTALNGKSAQLKVYQEKFFAVILDWELRDHTALEVIKYMSLNAPSTKIILIVKSLKVFDDLGIEKDDIIKLGVTDVLLRPYTQDQLLKSIAGELQFGIWKNVSRKRRNVESDSGVIRARDDEFTRINVKDFFSGKITVFDLFVRLSPDHYVKILHAGETFDAEVIKRYSVDKKVEYFYFRTQDRAIYIKYINKVLEKVVEMSPNHTEQKVKLIRNVTEKYIEEIYTSGVQPHLVEEGKKICEHIDTVARRDKNLAKVVRELEDFDPSAYSHAFLAVFFSSLVCNKLSWATRTTLEKITIGAMLHDIGKMKMPKGTMLLRPENMNPKQLEEYKQHPEVGIEMLSGSTVLTESTRQIIFQHHETMDGQGFPMGVTGMKIYPLAHVVGMVDCCVNIMTSKKMKPPEAYVTMLRDEQTLLKYDSTLLKAFGEIFLSGHLDL